MEKNPHRFSSLYWSSTLEDTKAIWFTEPRTSQKIFNSHHIGQIQALTHVEFKHTNSRIVPKHEIGKKKRKRKSSVSYRSTLIKNNSKTHRHSSIISPYNRELNWFLQNPQTKKSELLRSKNKKSAFASAF